MQFGSLSAFVAPCHLLHSCCLFQRGPWGVITLCTDEHDATTESPARTFDTSEKGQFRELHQCEVRRILISRTRVNKGMKKEKKGRDIVAHILASSKKHRALAS